MLPSPCRVALGLLVLVLLCPALVCALKIQIGLVWHVLSHLPFPVGFVIGTYVIFKASPILQYHQVTDLASPYLVLEKTMVLYLIEEQLALKGQKPL